MEYNFDKVQEADFGCEYCFLNNVMSEFKQLNPDDYSSILIVAGEDLAQDLFRELSEARCECNERIFNYGFVDFNGYEYEGEYIIALCSDGAISIERMITDNGNYLLGEGEIVFIHEDCNYRAIERMSEGNDKIVIFGFDE